MDGERPKSGLTQACEVRSGAPLSDSSCTVLVVGAGVSGLTAAWLLAQAGVDVCVLERESDVGGLARSFHYDGFTFDIGPHRFHSANPSTLHCLRDVLDGELAEIGRSSAIWFDGKHLQWPLTWRDLLALSPSLSAKAVWEQFARSRNQGTGLEQFLRSRYGTTVYREFFEPYTTKFARTHPSQLDARWGEVTIDRAYAERGARKQGLWRLLCEALVPAAVKERSLYPRQGGAGRFCRELARRMCARGGSVSLGTPATAVRVRNRLVEAVTAAGRSVRPKILLWTAPLTTLADCLGWERPPLQYLSTVLCNLLVDGQPRLTTQWTYFGQQDLIFSRVTLPGSFSPNNVPAGAYGLCVEVTARGEELAHRSADLGKRVIHDLISCGVLRTQDEVRAVHIEQIPESYPLYTMGYRAALDRFVGKLGDVDNLLLLGRTARFWYNNMDGSIEQAFGVAEQLVRCLSSRTHDRAGASVAEG